MSPGFQSNQLVQISKDLYFPSVENFELIAGIFLAIITAIVVVEVKENCKCSVIFSAFYGLHLLWSSVNLYSSKY